MREKLLFIFLAIAHSIFIGWYSFGVYSQYFFIFMAFFTSISMMGLYFLIAISCRKISEKIFPEFDNKEQFIFNILCTELFFILIFVLLSVFIVLYIHTK